MRLGVVLAGGRSRRFGSDKALALLGGRSLIETAVATLAAWCDEVVVAGREHGPAPTIADWPKPGCGPLGGIAAGLRHAAARGFDEVLSCGVDSHGMPGALPALLSPGPACLAGQPIVGLWPASACGILCDLLDRSDAADPRSRSLRIFVQAVGARRVTLASDPANINTPEDLARFEKFR